MKIERPKSIQQKPENAKKVFDGVVFDVYQWEQELFDGTKTTFEQLKRADTVVVFPILDDGRILLTEQEQPGRKPFIGATGGKVEKDEDVLNAAKRELLEETGYEASEFILWDAQQPISKIDWAVFTFIAKGLKKISEINLEAGEKIKLKPATFEELLELGTNENFAEKEIVKYLFEARLDLSKKEALRKLFNGKI